MNLCFLVFIFPYFFHSATTSKILFSLSFFAGEGIVLQNPRYYFPYFSLQWGRGYNYKIQDTFFPWGWWGAQLYNIQDTFFFFIFVCKVCVWEHTTTASKTLFFFIFLCRLGGGVAQLYNIQSTFPWNRNKQKIKFVFLASIYNDVMELGCISLFTQLQLCLAT